MTYTEARRFFRTHGILLMKTEFGEFRVCEKGASESAAYYTADLTDAIDTAITMWRNSPTEAADPLAQSLDALFKRLHLD